LGKNFTKILAFQSKYKAMTTKLDSVAEGFKIELKENGIPLPDKKPKPPNPNFDDG